MLYMVYVYNYITTIIVRRKEKYCLTFLISGTSELINNRNRVSER